MSAFTLAPTAILPTGTSSLISPEAQATAGKNLSPEMQEKHIDAVSKDFEAVFLSQMMGHMFGESTGSYFGEGAAGDIYKSYLLNEYGKSMAQAGGIGIASQVKQELMKLQEVKQ